jgi:hypothetical protein
MFPARPYDLAAYVTAKATATTTSKWPLDGTSSVSRQC